MNTTLVHEKKETAFELEHVLHELRHYLPAQAPLKDFIHHNTLHAFQHMKFHDGLRHAASVFGYKISMSLEEYRARFREGAITEQVLDRVVRAHVGDSHADWWKESLLSDSLEDMEGPQIGQFRNFWKRHYHVDLDATVHPLLFRLLCNYLDQGISMWDFPANGSSFLTSVRELERNAFTSFFRKPRARRLLKGGTATLKDLLLMLVGPDEKLWERYLFDQQFAHQGWSGMVATVETQPETLLDRKPISLEDLIYLECLFEIDALDGELGAGKWEPLGTVAKGLDPDWLAERPASKGYRMLAIWQDAFEWSYYDEVLGSMLHCDKSDAPQGGSHKAFQAMFCIDDRECSLRRYLEHASPTCETFGTPGFFGVEFYFQPEGGKFTTKLCPAPVTPKYLIKEYGHSTRRQKDAHLSKRSHNLATGLVVSPALGLWSALRLAWNIFRPSVTPATASSFLHHDHISKLTIEHQPGAMEGDLQVGFTVAEMAQRVEGLLRSIGLLDGFADLIYVVGHGSSSVNNPHYAAYDCGACSGRPGSVNARVICHMGNHAEVRKLLRTRGIEIPDSARFVGGLHDTTRDEIQFFDVDVLPQPLQAAHEAHLKVFAQALDANAKERSRRLELLETRLAPSRVHEKIKLRSVSLFEPRPELNHATNALCVVGRRALTRHLFLDRRSFLNSYDYRTDPEGKALLGILRAVAPVCGGINLEYFFSRVDNQKLGAGSKLPHNVMGLFGVANGTDGDLRPGLPSQMIEVHDPVRLLVIVEHIPQVVLDTIQSSPPTYEWFHNEWVHLVAFHPEEQRLYRFQEGTFVPYAPSYDQLKVAENVESLVEEHTENIGIYEIH